MKANVNFLLSSSLETKLLSDITVRMRYAFENENHNFFA